MEHNTGLIEAIMFEIKDRDKTWGSTSISYTSLCFAHYIVKADGCKQEKVIIHHYDYQYWPKCIQICFQGNNDVIRITPKIIPITKTSMYNLYFMFCDPQLKGTLINGETI